MEQLRSSSAEYELTGLEDRDEDTGSTVTSSSRIMRDREGKPLFYKFTSIDTAQMEIILSSSVRLETFGYYILAADCSSIFRLPNNSSGSIISAFYLSRSPKPKSQNIDSKPSTNGYDGYLPLLQYISNDNGQTAPIITRDLDRNVVSLYVHSNSSNHLYGFIPWSIISGSCKCNEASKYLLYTEQLTRGVGLREIFWDQGALIAQSLVFFELDSADSLNSGCNKKILLKAPELMYRDSAMLDKSSGAAKKSFATSLLWTFSVSDETADGVFVFLGDFILNPIGTTHHKKDLNSIIRSAYGTQYTYTADKSSSTIHAKKTKTNKYSTSIESDIAYSFSPSSAYASSSTPPSELDNVLPLGSSLVVGVRKTLLNIKKFETMHTCSCSPSCNSDDDPTELPIPFKVVPLPVLTPKGSTGGSEGVASFRMRPFHPKSGFNRISFMDEKQPLYGPRQKQYLTRQKILIEANASTIKTPQIVFAISKDTPSVIRDALQEGIQWWDNAFQYAGYPTGVFQAVIQNEDNFDPYIFHYAPRVHFVEWVDRDLRSYSFGGRIVDPRNGEILKGHVRIGALRLREDILLAAAFLGPFASFSNATSSDLLENGCTCCFDGLKSLLGEDILQAVLQRVKVLGAHEVGHALGLAHNFAGSSYHDGFASVMDYPPPLLQWDEVAQKIVLNNRSYANDVGFFDKVSIDYGYRNFENEASIKEGKLTQELYDIIADAEKKGYVFLTDEDADISGSDWRASRWNSGDNPIFGLSNSLQIRKYALKQLSEKAIAPFSPVSQIRQIFSVVYLFHRYEVEACAKLLGGVSYQYSMKSDVYNRVAEVVDAANQTAALHQLIATLHPEQLSVSNSLQSLLSTPPAFGFEQGDIGGSDDLLYSRTGANFDMIAAYETAAEVVISAVFNTKRLERLAAQSLTNSSQLSLGKVLETFTEHFIVQPFQNYDRMENSLAEVMAVQSVLVNRYLVIISESGNLKGCMQPPSALVLGQVTFHLKQIENHLTKVDVGSAGSNALWRSWDMFRLFLLSAIDAKRPFLTLRTPSEAPI